MTTAEASKYNGGICPGAARSSSYRLSPNAAEVPSATSRSMFPLRALMAPQAAR